MVLFRRSNSCRSTLSVRTVAASASGSPCRYAIACQISKSRHLAHRFSLLLIIWSHCGNEFARYSSASYLFSESFNGRPNPCRSCEVIFFFARISHQRLLRNRRKFFPLSSTARGSLYSVWSEGVRDFKNEVATCANKAP